MAALLALSNSCDRRIILDAIRVASELDQGLQGVSLNRGAIRFGRPRSDRLLPGEHHPQALHPAGLNRGGRRRPTDAGVLGVMVLWRRR